MRNRVTMADVAREAGVSLMTVSRALNNKDGISPETRTQILEIIHKLGYRPSSIARSLVTQRTGTIGLIVPDVSNPYFSGIAHGVAEIANEEGLSVLLCDTEEDPRHELEFLNVLEEKQVDGLLIAAPRQHSEKLVPLLKRHPHVVVINRLFDETEGFTASGYVINDDMAGGRMATQLLIDRGHEAIGFLAGPSTSYGSRRRHGGYRMTLEAAGLPYNPNYIRYCPPTVNGGREAALQLLADYPKITALFCFNDMVAIGALQSGAQLGRRVPEDLSIVGYDDIPMASWVTPALTTCKVPFEEMGRLATKLLIAHICDCEDGCENMVLTPDLIVRASTP
jgi:LacI family transcriptional regulator